MQVIMDEHGIYHIWDNDCRELACHRRDVVELIRKLQEALRKSGRWWAIDKKLVV